MYIPKINLMTNRQEAVSFMQRYNFATIITVSNGLPVATHLPFLVKEREGQIILLSHFAKANPQADELLGGKPLVVFAEPHAYISPQNYQHERNVPTWNYIAVHAYGVVTLLQSEDEKTKLLEESIQFYEAAYMQQWDALPRDYRSGLMQGIVAFEIVVDDLQAKKKLSQNRSATEQENIINDLSAHADTVARDVAEYMKKQR